MSHADLVWLLTAGLAAGSALILAWTMLARVLAVRMERRRLRVRALLLAELTHAAGAPAPQLRRAVRRAASLGALAPLMLQIRDVLRGQAYDAFVARLEEAGAAEALMRHLRRAATPDRLRAAEALASFRSVEARDALRRAWADPSVKVRFAALTASVETGHPPTFEHALTLALKRAHLPYAARLLESMARRRPAEAADWLNRVSLAPPLAIALLHGMAAASLADAAVATIVAIAKDHSSPDVRAAALAVLGEQSVHQCKEVILGALADETWFVRVRAAAAAGRLRIAEAAAPLVNLADDPNWWVRLRAREALTRLGQAAT